MQRFIVSAARVDKPWRYASLPGFEILSRAPPDVTASMLDALQRGLWLQSDVMPKDWLPKAPVPYTVIIDDTDLNTIPLGQPHSETIVLESPADAASWGSLGASAMIWSDELPAYDGDTLAFNANVFGIDMKGMTYGSVSMERLGRCAPPLPRWLMAGLIGQNTGIFREGFVPLISKGAFDAGWIHRAAGPGTIWISVEASNLLADQPTIEIPPLAGLFAEAPPSAEALPVWESEAALFVRWGLLGPGYDDPVMTRAFIELVRRARTEPVTEKIFTECFGFGYAEMEAKLESFLKTVLNKPMSIDLDMPSQFPRPNLMPATSDQIGRILGDWLRMEGVSLREKDPEMSKESLYFAGRTLVRAYKVDNGLLVHADPLGPGDPSPAVPQLVAPALGPLDLSVDKIHDPRLLAVLGLYAHDAGSDDKAREYLGAAAGMNVLRPRVSIVLAQLRLAKARSKPEGSGGKIGADQLAAILAPLRVALQEAPTAEAYHLLVETWAHSEVKPGEADIAEIAGGTELYPRDTEMAYNAALVCAWRGYPEQAGKIIDRGLIFTTLEANRQHFELLRARLEIPDSSGER